MATNVVRLIAQTLRFGLAHRRISVALVVLLGLVVLAVSVSAPVVVPFAIYPFA